VAADPRDEAGQLQQGGQRRADRGPAGRDAELVGAGRARLGRAEPRQDAKATRAERRELAWVLTEELVFVARQEREPQAWLPQAERPVVVPAARQERPVSAEPLAQRSLAQRGQEFPESEDVEAELAAQRRERAQAAWPEREQARESVQAQEQAVSPQPAGPAGPEQQASSEPLWQQLPSRLFRLRPLLQPRHPVRLVPESCGARFRRRRPGWSSSGSFFP